MYPRCCPSSDGEILLKVWDDAVDGGREVIGLEFELSEDEIGDNKEGEFFKPHGPLTLPYLRATAVFCDCIKTPWYENLRRFEIQTVNIISVSKPTVPNTVKIKSANNFV